MVKKEDERFGFESVDDVSPMGCVYASPEIMSVRPTPFSNGQTYPFIHAFHDDSIDDIMMNEVYGSPRMMFEESDRITVTKTKNNNVEFCGYCGKRVDSSCDFCNSCGNAIQMADPGATVQFCLKCERDNPMVNRYCVYCGNEMRPTRSNSKPITPMGCVYASPERMKEGAFKRLFRRKNK